MLLSNGIFAFYTLATTDKKKVERKEGKKTRRKRKKGRERKVSQKTAGERKKESQSLKELTACSKIENSE